MKIRYPHLTHLGLTTILLFLSGLVVAAESPAPSISAAAEPYADKYDLIKPPQPTITEDKVEVAEFFLYTCPHCHDFENYLNPWVETKPNYVEFVHVPAIFSTDNGLLLAKVYYTAEDLGVLNKIHAALFKAIHEEKRSLNDEAAFMKFFAEQGVSNEDFQTAFKSFSVDTKVRRAKQMTIGYGINGVPEMAVQGKYRLSSGKAGGYTALFKIVDYLAAKENKQRASLPQVTSDTPKTAETPKAAETSKPAAETKSTETPKTSPATTTQ